MLRNQHPPPHRHSTYSFVIHVTDHNNIPNPNSFPSSSSSSSTSLSPKLRFSAMKIFSRFGKLIMRLMLSLPPRGKQKRSGAGGGSGGDRFDPPKTSCSSYYSSHTHYSEAIADCIEFFNKSSQEGIADDHGPTPTSSHVFV